MDSNRPFERPVNTQNALSWPLFMAANIKTTQNYKYFVVENYSGYKITYFNSFNKYVEALFYYIAILTHKFNSKKFQTYRRNSGIYHTTWLRKLHDDGLGR